MCQICRKNPCAKQCPNNSENPVTFCDRCGADVFEGANVYQICIDGYPEFTLCEDCIEDARHIAEKEVDIDAEF
jgi:hypothetical protein